MYLSLSSTEIHKIMFSLVLKQELWWQKWLNKWIFKAGGRGEFNSGIKLLISIHNYLDALPFGFRANMIWVKLDTIHAEAQEIHLHVIKKNRLFLFPVHMTLDTPIYEQFWGMHIGSHINIWQALIVTPPPSRKLNDSNNNNVLF